MQRSQILDLYFVDARSKLIDIAAFLDRVERGDGESDYRLGTFQEALHALAAPRFGEARAEMVLLAFSDPSNAPAEHAGGKSATGAWSGKAK